MGKFRNFFSVSRSPVVRAVKDLMQGPSNEPVKMSPDQMRRLNSLMQVYVSEKPTSFTEFSSDVAVDEGMKKSAWVYACVWRLMKAASSVPWQVQRQDGNGNWVVVRDHPAARLLERPNPMMSRDDLIERTTAHLFLAGNSIYQKIRNREGKVVQLWPISPDRVEPIVDGGVFVSGYKLKNRRGWRAGVSDDSMIIPVKDIIHIQFTDPSQPYWGLGPLQAGARSVDTDMEALTWQKNSLSRRAVKDGVLTFKEELSQDQYNRIIAMIREQIVGSENARGPLVIGAESTYIPYTMTPAELDYVQSRKMTREEIASVFGVPPPLIGIMEQSTLANIKIARMIFWLDTIIPYLDDLAAGFTRSLIPDFEGATTSYRIAYDLSMVEALKQDFSDKLSMAKVLWSMGVPFQEVNRRLDLGFEPFTGWEVGWLPSTIRPVDTIQAEAQAAADRANSDSTNPTTIYDNLPNVGDQLISGPSDVQDPNNPAKRFDLESLLYGLKEAGERWS